MKIQDQQKNYLEANLKNKKKDGFSCSIDAVMSWASKPSVVWVRAKLEENDSIERDSAG